jgi:hypothetical protein
MEESFVGPCRLLAEVCGYRKRAETHANLAVTTFVGSPPNLGMCFSNACGVPPNFRRMERSIAMPIMAVRPSRPTATARAAIWNAESEKRS